MRSTGSEPFVAALLAAFGLAVAGCAGGAHTVVPDGATKSGLAVRVTIPITVLPPASTTGLVPSYYSPGTQSLNYFVYQSGTGVQAAMGTLANFTSSSTNCSTTPAGTVCSITFNVAPGSYYCTIATYTQPNGHGPVLSIQEYVPLGVAPNGTVTTPAWTLWGVPHTITATPTMTQYVRQSSGVVTDYGSAPVMYTILAYDQSGAQIVGPGMPSWRVSSTNASFTLTQPTAAAPNSFSIAPSGVAGPVTTQLSITGSFPSSKIDFCRIVGANCSTTIGTFNSLDVQNDDWLTFAHDYQRTGTETQPTGLSVSSAPKLALRWQVQVPNRAPIQANAAVYNGNVIVVTGSPAVVYDLSAIDGSVLWQRPIPGGAAKPPTIDPAAGAHGLVFVGNRIVTGNNLNQPSSLYALNLNDGSIAWQTTVNGLTRSAEVIVNGKIYIGTAGGDPPQCLNAGVQQVDEATGNVGWTWYVNSITNPGGGGGVWGAIAYDGSNLIFGTGNVCQASGSGSGAVTTSDGAAILSPSGELLATFVAWAQTGPNAINLDYDTGSSILIRNPSSSAERITFLNKNGYLYTFGTSGLLHQTAANPNYGYGFYTSPTSDGTYTVVQTGAYSNSAVAATRRVPDRTIRPLRPDIFTPSGTRRPSRTIPGFHSYLEAFDSTGTSKWAYEMQTFIAGYAAIDNGVVVSQGDNSVVALATAGNGTPLWQYATAGVVDDSPAVVPSGIYIGDNNGNVYAFAPPYATQISPSTAKQPSPR
jgi:outer membrane protein assembly factor BamB